MGGAGQGLIRADGRRIAAAIALVFVATMALALVGALWLPRGPHQLLVWLAPAAVVGPTLFRGGRLAAAASLALCILPALISAEALAHLFGYFCNSRSSLLLASAIAK